MRDKGYYYAKINAYEREIDAYTNTINKKNQHINELTLLKSKVLNYEITFDEVQRNRRNHLSFAVEELFSRKRYSQKIIQGYELDMNELLSGSEQQHVFYGLEAAEETIATKIRALNNEIEDCYDMITECNRNIETYRKDIQHIEKREQAQTHGGYYY